MPTVSNLLMKNPSMSVTVPASAQFDPELGQEVAAHLKSTSTSSKYYLDSDLIADNVRRPVSADPRGEVREDTTDDTIRPRRNSLSANHVYNVYENSLSK